MHTIDVPTEFDGRGGPDCVLSVGETSCVVSLLSDVKVELFVGAADCSDISGVGRPIEAGHERVVLRERLVKSVRAIVAHSVDVEVVVMGGEGKILLIWGIAGNLAPFLCVLQGGDLSVKVVEVTDGYFSHVAANDQVIVFGGVADGSGLLVGRVD